jgi:hypothetical protein
MYIVGWTPRAMRSLADLCLSHPGRWTEINAAEVEITDKLQRRPLQHSQEVSEGLRRIISLPFVVYFSVDGNRVEVDAVGRMG